MPTYQYVCQNPETKHDFEVVQSFNDPAVATCPECAAPVRKVYGSVGVVFKGSGFYRTDSRKESSTSGAATSKDSSGAGKDSSSTGTASSTSSTASTTSASSSTSSGSAGKAAAN